MDKKGNTILDREVNHKLRGTQFQRTQFHSLISTQEEPDVEKEENTILSEWTKFPAHDTTGPWSHRVEGE